METRDEQRYTDPSKKRVRIFNSNIPVFAFFVILSFVFWYLNSLGKDIETDIKYPVRFSNHPRGVIITGILPSRLNILLKGPGYSILKMKISGNKTPLNVDLSRTSPKRAVNSKSSEYYILTSDLVANINSQLKSGCKIISLKPDTLFLTSGQVSK